MKYILVLFFPLVIFSQQTTLVGDVDCNGELNSEDASLILQYVTSVIDSLPCEENMSGLTPDQLQEMIEMMNGQLIINYGGISFGDWILKYDNPNFDDFIYGQEETDGFLLIQYSRENQISSSASFGFNIHIGSDIDTTDFNMDVSINVKASWNPINSKTIPIRKGDYWVLENFDDWTVEVSIDKVYFLPINSQVNINESDSESSNTQNSINKNITFPDGYGGEPITWSCLNNGTYIVPEDKNLYITQYFSGPDDELTVDDIILSSGYSNNIVYTGVGFSPSLTNNMPFIIGEGKEIDGGNFNGFLKNSLVTPITINTSIDSYIVPDGKILYIMQYFGESSSELIIDDVTLSESYNNNIFYSGVGFTPQITFSIPVIAGEGQVVSGGGNFNGYIVNQNYFLE